MILKFKTTFFSLFFLSLGLLYSFQAIFWEMGDIAWMTMIVSFVLIPIFDFLLGKGFSPNLSCFGKFSFLIPRLYFFVHFSVLIFYLSRAQNYQFIDLPVLGLAVGTISGAVGITVAHELMHKRSRLDKLLSKAILCSVCYGHFFIEHLRGHHARVATPYDCATAKRGQTVYSFLIQSIIGSLKHSWKLEKMKLEEKGLPTLSIKNSFLIFFISSIAFSLAIFIFFGINGLLLFLIQSIWAIILLEITNYIEHYGLIREFDKDHGYSAVTSKHSWNSNHLLSNWILLHLPWHSDHHKSMSKPFNTLKPINEAPQLPYGYPTMIILSLFPFLFIPIMNKRLDKLDSDK